MPLFPAEMDLLEPTTAGPEDKGNRRQGRLCEGGVHGLCIPLKAVGSFF